MKDNRVLGFDFLRGLCAIGVAYHHLLYYLGYKKFGLINVGYYGVYIFFVLSGASIYIAYADRIRAGYDLRKFIAQRLFRLAPLFAVAVMLVQINGDGYTLAFFKQAILNVTFAFGLGSPGTTSMVTGGWSLGIEFVFYLIFPTILAFISGSFMSGIVLFLGVSALQILYIQSTVSPDGNLTGWYTQFLSFGAYFIGGCLIGKCLATTKYTADKLKLQALLWLAFIVLVAMIVFSDGEAKVAPLVGSRAIVLMAASIALVFVAGFVKFQPRITAIALAFGNMSYGLYLLHPYAHIIAIVYFKKHLPESKADCATAIIIAAAVTALIIERFFERPITNFGKRVLNRVGKANETQAKQCEVLGLHTSP